MHGRFLQLLATLVAVNSCVLACSLALGQSEDTAIVAEWKNNSEVRQCGLCHFSPGNDFATRDTDFCRMIEAKVWLADDKHAIARRRIEPIKDGTSVLCEASNRLSFAIVSRLGYAIETESGYAQFRDNCLTCHAGYEGRDESHEFERTASHRPGISCNVCHQVGQNSGWIDEHSGINAKQIWRTNDPKSKAARGMRSLVTVDDQADLCLSCHVGDIKQNKFVTHQMYAAGHPPLPSVELGALIDAMPRHWRSNAELYQSLERYHDRDLYFRQNFGSTVESNQPIDQLNWQTQAIVSGAIAAYQKSLSIVEQAASPNSKRWGDYALYDCSGCHHELKVPSSRQAARIGSPPGRPRLAEWPQALSHAAFACTEEKFDIEKIQKALEDSVAEIPFGNRTKVALQASQMNTLLSRFREQLKREALTVDFAKRYVEILTQTPETDLIDYHVARQINWALRGIDSELLLLQSPLPESVRGRIAGLGMVAGVTQVESQIPGSQLREIFPTFVNAELKRQSQYDAKQFHSQLNSILGPSPKR